MTQPPLQFYRPHGATAFDQARVSVAARNLISDRNFAFDDRFSAASNSRLRSIRERLFDQRDTPVLQVTQIRNTNLITVLPFLQIALHQAQDMPSIPQRSRSKRSPLSAFLSRKEIALQRIRARVGDRSVAKVAKKVDELVEEDEDVILVGEFIGEGGNDADRAKEAALQRIISRVKSRGKDSERLFDSVKSSRS